MCAECKKPSFWRKAWGILFASGAIVIAVTAILIALNVRRELDRANDEIADARRDISSLTQQAKELQAKLPGVADIINRIQSDDPHALNRSLDQLHELRLQGFQNTIVDGGYKVVPAGTG